MEVIRPEEWLSRPSLAGILHKEHPSRDKGIPAWSMKCRPEGCRPSGVPACWFAGPAGGEAAQPGLRRPRPSRGRSGPAGMSPLSAQPEDEGAGLPGREAQPGAAGAGPAGTQGGRGGQACPGNGAGRPRRGRDPGLTGASPCASPAAH
jgi:hypothetical protein